MNAKVEKEVNAGQMVMFGGVTLERFNPDIQKVFGVTPREKVAKDGRVLYTERLAMVKRGDIAKSLQLTGKDNRGALDAKIQEIRDELMRGAKGKVASLDDDWTFKSSVRKDLSNGNETLSVVFERINRAHSSVELRTMAEALGCTVAELMEKLKAHNEAARAKAAKPANATLTPPVGELKAPETTPEELDARAAADLEAEEAARLSQEAEPSLSGASE